MESCDFFFFNFKHTYSISFDVLILAVIMLYSLEEKHSVPYFVRKELLLTSSDRYLKSACKVSSLT